MINHEDDRQWVLLRRLFPYLRILTAPCSSHPPVPQVIFYQRGVGTDKNLYSEFVDGTSLSRCRYILSE